MTNNSDILTSISVAQKKIWYAQQLNPDETLYNIADIIEFGEALNLKAFTKAVQLLINECDILRARFVQKNGAVYYHIDTIDKHKFAVTVPPKTYSDKDIEEFVVAEAKSPIDLINGPLYKFLIVSKSNGYTYFLQKYHHIIADGASFPIITKRLFDLYDRIIEEKNLDSNYFDSYASFIDREAKYYLSDRYEVDRSFWNQKVSSESRDSQSWITETATLSNLAAVSRKLDASTRQLLIDTAKKIETSLPNLFIIIAAIFHCKVANVKNVNINVIFSGRGSAEKRTPGMMSHTLPVPFIYDGHLSLQNVIGNFSKELRTSLRHGRYLNSELEHVVAAGRGLIVNPSINFMTLDYGTAPLVAAQCPAFGPAYGFTINAYNRVNLDELIVQIASDKSLGDEDYIQNLLIKFNLFLDGILCNPDHSIGSFELLDEDERQKILFDWNDTTQPIPDATLPELFEA
ncbi:condensation domain-containing protein, partial [Lentilitoribacter sp. EG35]|uniref:condensation domain-containing protein n=1 Tax=Lentilitoribacter sp. EG35 TaxID=3234192 RepID=UPI003460526F